MDKGLVLSAIVQAIDASVQLGIAAADEAKATATSKENIAENKYDTLGLEAAYLAHGQSERVMALQQSLTAYQKLQTHPEPHLLVDTGSLIELRERGTDVCRYYFVGPSEGGLSVTCAGATITIVTLASPVGSALAGLEIDDEVSLSFGGRSSTSLITGLW